MSKISPPELEARLEGEDPPYVLDIRPRAGYQREHVPGSHNVPVYGDLRSGDDADLRAAIEDVPNGKEVVTVCKAGIVARKATAVLEEEGYEATTLAGGMRRWRGYQNGSLGYRIRSALTGLLP
ncbi:rhodanese-like domain-containing protein [Natrarchaeobaculum aegyptiacum]|uniref:Thiosulfate sulfurtransferase n=1 Tax=Natrarchaeobaculum aegyptiacum TaxID=745377 RepID=A0A2Z2HQH9_9EURY|nr:rhodanese-like domain-containing protein [Natrarchaeobaculum aegyptiacum]ARS89371.1 thiosulfate sulfurtransferase [Natrarchaeobaculum aegyptiacum]